MSSENANEFSRESYLRNVRMRGADLEDPTAHEFALGASGSSGAGRWLAMLGNKKAAALMGAAWLLYWLRE